MADPKETESTQTPTTPATPKAPDAKKKASRPKMAPRQSARKGLTKKPTSKAEASAAIKTTRKVYSEKERAQKLGQIEKSTGRGESIKNAVKLAGISEQTYYQWKKAPAPVSGSGDLKGLLALEEENIRLKKLLAERLRKENADLKKKLGLS